jgi:hypothetical protein
MPVEFVHKERLVIYSGLEVPEQLKLTLTVGDT